MSQQGHAPHSADRAVYETVTVLANEQVANRTCRLRFSAVEMARRFLPGQFLMLRIDGLHDPLIGRPLALFDRVDDELGIPVAIDVVYLVEGKLTTRLASLRPGQTLNVWGPLGNGFLPREVDNLIMVAGGIGQTPFLALAKEVLGVQRFGVPIRSVGSVRQVILCYGARSADFHAGVDDFRALEIDVRLASDDGSVGFHGFVTDVLGQTLDELPKNESVHVVCCGPQPMMEAVSMLSDSCGVPCEVSLEEPMACGIGICFACVAKIRPAVKMPTTLGEDGECDWDYQRTCVDGPVFDAQRVVWREG